MTTKRKQPPALPTYQELADIVARLTESCIANVDCPTSDQWVTKAAYGLGVIPTHWQRAIDARAALIANRIVK